MNINGESVSLTNKEKAMLINFFESNYEFLKNKNLYKYENLKMFGDLYELYLKDNKLDNNNKLKLFLAELRLEQLTFKITEKSNKMQIKANVINLSRIELTDTLKRWVSECLPNEEQYNEFISKIKTKS